MQKKLQLSLLSLTMLSQLHAHDIGLETLTVTAATKTEQKLKDVTATTEVITAEEIKERRYTTVSQALSSLSGISFTNNGGVGKATSVFVRGFDSKHVLVLIDGVRMNDITSLSGAPFSHMMISDIERIELIKGAQSGIWGADASAGVINIVTKSPQNGLQIDANAEFGTYQTKKFGANLSYKTDDFYIKAASELFKTDSFSAKAPRDSENDPYRNSTTNLKAGVAITENNKIDFSYTLINATNEYDPYLTNGAPLYDYNASKSANGFAEEIVHDSFSQISYNHSNSFNEFTLYSNSSKFERQYNDSYPATYKGEINEYGANSKVPYRHKDFLFVSFDYKKFIQKDANVENSYTNKAGAITNSNTLMFNAEELIITEVVRYDQYNKFNNKTTGKLGLRYNSQLLKGVSVNANYATGYNVPTLSNLYGPWGANANLKPEDTKSFDIGIAYKGFSANYFYNTMKNMIEYVTDPVTFASQYKNIEGKSILKGFELAYNNYLSDEILVGISYNYLDAKNKEGQTLARRPKQSVKYALTYYATPKWDLTLDGEYIGKRYDSVNDQGTQTGKYTLLNFVTNFKINKNMTTFFKVENLSNKDYEIVDGYATAQRSFFVGLNLKIK